MYKTSCATCDIGIYSAQRPSIAACKAFTVLRLKDKGLQEAIISVDIESHKKTKKFKVTYEQVLDPFLGQLMRPVANAIDAIQDEKNENDKDKACV